MSTHYTTYLQLDKILNAQNPKSPHEQDEMLFIVIHQVYELWFKQILHEGLFLKKSLIELDLLQSTHTLRRILTILKTMVKQIDILETMTPLSFLSFRNLLENASGFQSVQFRQFEIFLGARRKLPTSHFDSNTLLVLENDMKQPSLYDVFFIYLEDKLELKLTPSIKERDYFIAHTSREDAIELIYTIYKKKPQTAAFCELMVDLDEGLQEWRYRHVKMVERTIGSKMGTGQSPGAEYLKSTLFTPYFPELWQVRSRF